MTKINHHGFKKKHYDDYKNRLYLQYFHIIFLVHAIFMIHVIRSMNARKDQSNNLRVRWDYIKKIPECIQ